MKFAPLLAAALAVLEPGRQVGLDFVHRHSPTSQKYLLETMGGGVGVLDYNNDGLLDVFLVNGGKLNDPQAPGAGFARANPTYWNRLYRQNRDSTFTDVTANAGLSAGPDSYGMGIAAADYDNDGNTDLYVTAFGRNTLYHNDGNGRFTDVTARAGVAAGGWSVSAGFFDYDNDGRLDLFVSRYLDWDLGRNILCGTPYHAYCRPDKYEGTNNLLFHNEGGGRFRDVSAESGIAAVRGKGMGVAFGDYDGDGRVDVFVSNDGMEQFLFRNQGGGKFEERAIDANVAFSDDGQTYAGMGAVFADYNNDGRLDIAVTNLALEKFALYRNEADGTFQYASLTTGLAGLTASSSGWGLGLHDFDNDGWKDLFAAQGHVLDNVERMHSGLRYLEPPALYRNRSGRFEKADIGSLAPVAGRGAAFGDLDNDGFMDAVVCVLGGRPVVLRGRPNGNHWLTIELQGTRSNHDGLGAVVRIDTQVVHATTSGSYLAAHDRRVHFGLGASSRLTVEIAWPSGARQKLENIAADRIITVKEPE